MPEHLVAFRALCLVFAWVSFFVGVFLWAEPSNPDEMWHELRRRRRARRERDVKRERARREGLVAAARAIAGPEAGPNELTLAMLYVEAVGARATREEWLRMRERDELSKLDPTWPRP